MAFRLCSTDDWDDFGLSRGGLIVLKRHIVKLVGKPGTDILDLSSVHA